MPRITQLLLIQCVTPRLLLLLQLFQVGAGGELVMTGLELRGGQTSDALLGRRVSEQSGIAMPRGGGALLVHNGGRATLIRCTVSSCTGTGGGAVLVHGMGSSARFEGCGFAGCAADGGQPTDGSSGGALGSAIAGYGGAILATGLAMLEIFACTFDACAAVSAVQKPFAHFEAHVRRAR